MFDDRYQVVLADTEEGKKIHYNLRYKIYCQEKKYEDTNKFLEQMETDEYDKDAVHFLIRDKQTGDWMAVVRMVIGPVQQLPIQKVASIHQEKLDTGEAPIAEISRFSILRNYRNNTNSGSEKDKPVSEPEIMLGLFRAVVAYGKNNGISRWLFLCRQSLKRIMNQCGFSVEEVGPKISYRGIRYPYLVSLEKSFSQLQQLAPKIGSMFSKSCAYYYYSELPESSDYRRAA